MRSKLVNQFNELIDFIRVLYLNNSTDPLFNQNGRLLAPVQSIQVNDNQLQELFDKSIERIDEFKEKIKQQYLVFSKFNQLSMNIRKYNKFYQLVWLKDIKLVLKQTVDIALESNQTNFLTKFNKYIEFYINLNYDESENYPKIDLTKLKYESTNEPTKFELMIEQWRKELKKLNQKTLDLMNQYQVHVNGRVLLSMSADTLINRIMNFRTRKQDEQNELTELDYNLFNNLINQTEIKINNLTEETIKYDTYSTRLQTEFNDLIEDQLKLGEQIYSNFIGIMNLDENCCQRLKTNDQTCYKQIIHKLPTDAAYLRSLKI